MVEERPLRPIWRAMLSLRARRIASSSGVGMTAGASGACSGALSFFLPPPNSAPARPKVAMLRIFFAIAIPYALAMLWLGLIVFAVSLAGFAHEWALDRAATGSLCLLCALVGEGLAINALLGVLPAAP